MIRPSALRVGVRLPLFLLVNAVTIPLYAMALGPARRWRRPIQVFWCRAMLRLVGLHVHTIGTPHRGGPTLYVANHASYLDIPVLSRRLQGAFVAKSDVAHWPLFGIISRLTGTIFVSRQLAEARVQGERIRAHLAAGGNLLLFPEGTSTDGSGVAPFKAAPFDLAAGRGKETVVQPVSIAYPRYADGTPLTGSLRELYCWYGDMTLLPHLLKVFALRGAEVELRFHPPVHASQFPGRKALARHSQEQVAAGVAAAQPAASGSDRAAE